ncbi:SUMO-activating enzyme subunit 1 [Cimex lectularius]|uniref:SUMO-activating enzyme subunit 1 n=1 Tax=Cimex lectularius TaxID=79782 RepID=A0A8I6S8A7_CIMLE|nr:SUMO-activating enzyme subunit 1 [Cimex lectularius]
MVEAESGQLTEAEAQLYDRQIRLWGLEAQKRLRNARVLIVGMGGLGAEVAKNIILTGVKAVSLMDHKTATEADLMSQFFIPQDKLGENRAVASLERAKALNPLVEVSAESCNVSDLSEEFFLGTRWDIVIASGLPISQYVRIDDICRKENICFFIGDVFGMFGFLFSDLNKYNFVEDVVTYQKAGIRSVQAAKKVLHFPSLRDSLNSDFTKDSQKGKLRRMEGSYFVMNILMKFRTDYCRDPLPTTSDINVLIKMRDKECFELSLPNEKIPDELISKCVGAPMSHVCAILGAVLSQEVVKAISRKDAPHRNMFFFDPVKNIGHVQYISPD